MSAIIVTSPTSLSLLAQNQEENFQEQRAHSLFPVLAFARK